MCPSNPFQKRCSKCREFRYGGKGINGAGLCAWEKHARNCAGIIVKSMKHTLCTRCGHFVWRLPLHQLSCAQSRKAKPNRIQPAKPKDRNANPAHLEPLGSMILFKSNQGLLLTLYHPLTSPTPTTTPWSPATNKKALTIRVTAAKLQ